MPGSTPPALHAEFLALIGCLVKARCRFIVVGGQALAVAGKPRFTQDLDILVEPSEQNAARVGDALTAFGFGKLGKAVRIQFRLENKMATLGVVPVAVDIMTSITGVSFASAWKGRAEVKMGRLKIPFLGRTELLKNKLASGREKDLIDAANLRELIQLERPRSRTRPRRRKRD